VKQAAELMAAKIAGTADEKLMEIMMNEERYTRIFVQKNVQSIVTCCCCNENFGGTLNIFLFSIDFLPMLQHANVQCSVFSVQ